MSIKTPSIKSVRERLDLREGLGFREGHGFSRAAQASVSGLGFSRADQFVPAMGASAPEVPPTASSRTRAIVTTRRSIALLLVLLSLTSLAAFAKDKKDKKDKKKETKAEEKLVDSGSFGVFVNGQRVATETFNIKQIPEGSITTSDIKVEGSNQSQHTELQLSTVGNLVRYTWKENGGEKGETDVEPSDQFLIQHIKAGDKYTEQPYIMPVSTAILDDYFFSQRELLLWRYLGAGCVKKPGENGCPLEPAKYGFIIPRQRTSAMATISYIGRETIMLHGEAKELSKFSISSDYGDWLLYLDENSKLVRVLVPGEATEVIRDLP